MQTSPVMKSHKEHYGLIWQQGLHLRFKTAYSNLCMKIHLTSKLT